MSTRLADRLSAARRRLFVGREAEQALFESALSTAHLPFHLLYVFGIGGVGKTTLLRQFLRMCEQSEIAAVYLDTRNVEPSPTSFLNALQLAMNLGPSSSPVQALAEQSCRQVLLIDTYERLVPLDAWVRETFLPQLPEHTLIVLAGRHPPAPAWLTDPGWASLLRPLALGCLSRQESLSYLIQRQVPVEQQHMALTFTRGHPLALALVADVVAQHPDIDVQPEAVPAVVNTLLHQFIEQVPSAAHRAALEACALVRTTTETLLSEMLANPDVYELFAWLRDLSFIETGPHGLFPHDLAREALAADLRWRDPDYYAQLGRRASSSYIKRLQQARNLEQDRLVFDLIFLHRNSPVIRPLFERFEWHERGGVFIDVARESDVPELVAMVAQHEGEESARLAAHWLARQLDRAVVFRETTASSSSAVAGFVLWLALHEASEADVNADPATRIAWQYVQAYAPLRRSESAMYRRFEMARDTYQAPSAIQSLNVVDWERQLLNTPVLGPVFKTYADPDFWTSLLAYAEVPRMPDLDFEVGGRRYAVFGLDLRTLSPLARLAMLTEKFTGNPAPTPLVSTKPAALLGQLEFATAVRDVLRSFYDPGRLSGNPLLRSRLVIARVTASANETERIAALLEVVRQAVEALQPLPRHSKWYRALYYTYLHPAPTQEQAAEMLDVPISTFRRHLSAGIGHVVETLWQQEISGSAK